MWLQRALDLDPTIKVFHEPIKRDRWAYHRVYRGELDPMDYFPERREIIEGVIARHKLDYGEVNSYTRYFAHDLHFFFGVPVVAIVRDGRYTVRSLMFYTCYQRHAYPPIYPPRKLGLKTPFEKCCWYWAHTYRVPLAGIPTFRLEDLNTDHSTFRELCDLISVDVPLVHWRTVAGRRKNVAIEDTEPPEWDNEQRMTFARLAGDIQEKFGYDFD
jgi:hypothetical protein